MAVGDRLVAFSTVQSPHRPASSTAPRWDELDAVLFDLDGVITPTAEVHRRAWRETFQDVLPQVAQGEQQVYRDDDYARNLDGRPRFDGVRRLLESHDVDLPMGAPTDAPGVGTVCAIGNMKNERFGVILADEPLSPFPGSMAMIGRVKTLGMGSAVVSSSANASSVMASAGISDVFDVVVDGEVIASLGLRGKPHPAPFIEAARRLGIEPDRCVVIEDAIAGVEAGCAGGFGLVVGVARDVDPARLRDAGADLVIADLGELM